jgi:CRISPR-associated protein Cas1
MNVLPPLKPIAMKERLSLLFVEKGQLDVLDGAFVVVDQTGVRTHIPVGSVACLMLEPGTKLALDDDARLKVVRKMYAMRFKEEPPARRSVEQLRGIEGVRVRKMYELLAQRHGVTWSRRNYDYTEWNNSDVPNRCLSAATACLYGITEAAVLAAGYAPAVGFIHTGKPLSFVYDIADVFKFDTVVPVAFRIAATGPSQPEIAVRHACRDVFRETRLLGKIIPTIEEILAAGELAVPSPHEEAVEPAIPNRESLGDVGHRS